jgi:hypothetical protein
VRVELGISVGELLDRICILELKKSRLSAKFREEAASQLDAAQSVANSIGMPPRAVALLERLREVNASLWEYEEGLRACERAQDFGPRFIELARGVYRTNDQRSALKRAIDGVFGSPLRELKSFDLPELWRVALSVSRPCFTAQFFDSLDVRCERLRDVVGHKQRARRGARRAFWLARESRFGNCWGGGAVMLRPGRANPSVERASGITSRVATRLADPEALDVIVQELQSIERTAGIERTLAIGGLILSRFFGNDPSIWRDRRRNKNNSIRRLAQRRDCPYCKSALTEAVAVYVAVQDLECVRTYGHISASHVAAVLGVERAERGRFLEEAELQKWSVRELKQHVVALRRASGERRGRPRSSQEKRRIGLLCSALGALEKALADLESEPQLSSHAMRAVRQARQQLEGQLGRVADLARSVEPTSAPRLVPTELVSAELGATPRSVVTSETQRPHGTKGTVLGVPSLAEETTAPADAAAQ